MEYIVVSATDMDFLVINVNMKLRAGWVLQGGISVSESREQGYTNKIYAQAMIKETK